MSAKVREATEKLLKMVEEGLLDRDTVIMACVKYMSEDDVADMCHINEFFYDEDDEDEEEPVCEYCGEPAEYDSDLILCEDCKGEV